MSRKKSVRELVNSYYEQIVELHPTPEEISAYADFIHDAYGVVTCSKSRGGSDYFIDFHDTWGKKFGGRVHIDVGYVDSSCLDRRDVPDTLHLMLNKQHAPEFIDFIQKRRTNND